MSVWLRQPLLLEQQPDEDSGIIRASCPATHHANRSILYSVLALNLSAVLLPASVVCIASLAFNTPTQQIPTSHIAAAAPVSLQENEVMFLQAAAVCSVLALGISSCSLWHNKWTRRQAISCLLLLCSCWGVVTVSVLAVSSSSSSSSAGLFRWLPETAVIGALSLAVTLPAAPLFILAMYAIFTLQAQREFTAKHAEGLVLLGSLGFGGLLLLLAVPGSLLLQLVLLGGFVLSGSVFSSYAVAYVEAAVFFSSSSSSSKGSSATAKVQAQLLQEEQEDEEGSGTDDTLHAALVIAVSGGCLVLLSFAALATVFTAADVSALLLSHITDLPTCNPLWISDSAQSASQSEQSSYNGANWAMLLLVAVSVLLHSTYAGVYRLHHTVLFGAWGGADQGSCSCGPFAASGMHPLLLVGLQLSCLAVGLLVGLASCAV